MTKRTASVAVLLAFMLILLAVAGCGSETDSGEKAALTFIQFYDPACPFCQKMEPIVEDLQAEYEPRIEEFRIVNITTDEGRDMVEEFGVFLTPTFVILDADGEELDRVTGAATEEAMKTFIDRGIDDVNGVEADSPRETIEGEGTTIDEGGSGTDEPSTE